MTGPVFRPLRSQSMCTLLLPHDHSAERPAAAYLLFIEGCLSKKCSGGLWCLGHAICIDCGMGVREGRLHYVHHEETPRVQAVMSR